MTDLKDKVVFGGLYRVLHNYWDNDQSYGLAVPIVDDKGNLYMQDTYQIQSPFVEQGETKFDACVRRMVEFGDGEHYGALNHTRYNFYHKNQAIITSKDGLNRYELIADLRNYHASRGDEWKDYEPEDIIHGVKLYFEHGYSWDYGTVGITVIRKDAVKSSVRILEKDTQYLWQSMCRPDSWNHRASAVQDDLESVEDNDANHEFIVKAKFALTMHKKLKELQDEYDEYYKNTKKELGL